jgi:hypothetical protein
MVVRFNRLERLLADLLEGRLVRLFVKSPSLRQITVELAHAMKNNALPGLNQTRLAPTRYDIFVTPADFTKLHQGWAEYRAQVAPELERIAGQLGLQTSGEPALRLMIDPSLNGTAIRVTANSKAEAHHTDQQSATHVGRVPQTPQLPKAFFIIDGETHVPLGQAIVTIGRQTDNQIILNDSRVSRYHAQVRYKFRRWMITDLNSTAGIVVNGRRVAECVLRAGDVVLLGLTQLIFNEEDTSANRSVNRNTDTFSRLPKK